LFAYSSPLTKRQPLRGFAMPTSIALPQPKILQPQHFLLERSVLGVPLVIWAIAVLLILVAARFDAPVMTFDAQQLLAL
jgi:hypothetical protein